MMNRYMNITPELFNLGRMEAYVEPPRARIKLDDIGKVTEMTFERGQYKRSPNPLIWTWDGPKIPVDPYKKYKRDLAKWEAKMRKLSKQGVWADTVIPPRPRFHDE